MTTETTGSHGSSGVASLETSEERMAEVADAVRREFDQSVYEDALDELQRRMAVPGTREGPEIPSGDERTGIRALFDELGVGETAAIDEAHALGWFHQYFGEPERRESFRAHTGEEAKHRAADVTTQLYTPRWIADLLAERALPEESEGDGTVHDPAVGGGQMLLAAYDVMKERHPSEPIVERVQRLSGRDIDSRAVEVARRNLKLRVAREHGERHSRAEAAIDEQIVVGDGLFGSAAGAEVVLTNPPYMGLRSMPSGLKDRVRDRYEPFHRDLYSAFIRRAHELASHRIGILAQQGVWYLKSFAKARRWLLAHGDLEDFVHIGSGAFASLDGEKADVAAFVQRTEEAVGRSPTVCLDVRDVDGRRAMRAAVDRFVDERRSVAAHRREVEIEALASIPGHPLAHWLPEPLREQFESGAELGEVAEIPGCQNKTADNARFVREFGELDADEGWRAPLRAVAGEASERRRPPQEVRWIPYSKGGRYAPWWGNWEYAVDWSEEARSYYRENSTSNLIPERYRFREGICYTDFGGHTFNARWMPPGVLFDMAGPAIFPDPEADGPSVFALLGLLNSTPVRMLLNAMNPSIHYQVTDLRRLPLPEFEADVLEALERLARKTVRALHRIAAQLPSSPVPGDMAEGRDPRTLLDRCRRRERRIDRLSCRLYGLDPETLEPIRPTHRYAARVDD